jgi:hypothetical protein
MESTRLVKTGVVPVPLSSALAEAETVTLAAMAAAIDAPAAMSRVVLRIEAPLLFCRYRPRGALKPARVPAGVTRREFNPAPSFYIVIN